jgi:hypothetical protein
MQSLPGVDHVIRVSVDGPQAMRLDELSLFLKDVAIVRKTNEHRPHRCKLAVV